MTTPDKPDHSLLECMARAIAKSGDICEDVKVFPCTPDNPNICECWCAATAVIAAHKAALEDAGLVIVPREPTEAMIEAGYTAAMHEYQSSPGETLLDAVRRRIGETSYQAMIAEATK